MSYRGYWEGRQETPDVGLGASSGAKAGPGALGQERAKEGPVLFVTDLVVAGMSGLERTERVAAASRLRTSRAR